MYRKYPALYANDCGYEGFQWINANDGDRSIYSFVRWSPTGKNNLLFVCNFTPVERPDYMCGVPRKKQYRLILDSSDMKYGGPTEKRQVAYRAKRENAMASHIGLHMHFRRMVWRCSASKIR